MLDFFKKKFRFLEYKKYRLPKYKKNIWYNYSAYSKGQFPIIFNEYGIYIECKIDMIVQMENTKCGKKSFYKVIKVWNKKGSDFICQSDSVNCNLEFSHVSNQADA
jgi:hypothetical protein